MYTLVASIWLPVPREELFPFFADARNLERITPSTLKFEVLTPPPIVMGEGTLIDYRLRVRGIPLKWRTLIKTWEPPFRFVDVQVKGPYTLWHHEHSFHPAGGGTLCYDRVDYNMLCGPIVHRLLVRRDVENIFRYRSGVLAGLFGGGRDQVELEQQAARFTPDFPAPAGPQATRREATTANAKG